MTGQQPIPAPGWCTWCGHHDLLHQSGWCAAVDDGDPLFWLTCDCDGFEPEWGDDEAWDDDQPDDGPPVPQPVTTVALEEYL